MPWEHLVTRRLAVQVAIAWNLGFGKLMEAAYGAGIQDTLVYFDGHKTEYFVDQEEHKAFNAKLDTLLEDPKAVERLIPNAKRFVEGKYEFIRKLIENAKALGNGELASLYERLARHHAKYYTRMWVVFRIGEAIASKLERLLAGRVGAARAKELTRIFSVPLEPNDAVRERIELAKTPAGKPELLERHAQQYKHIPMYDFDHEPFTLDHFRQQWEHARLESHDERAFARRKEQFEEHLKRLDPDPKLHSLILMQKDAVFLRDYRDTIRQKLNLALRDFYAELGTRIGLSVKEIALLTNGEIASCVRDGTPFPKDETARRQQGFLIIQHGEKIELFSGKQAHAKALKLPKPARKAGSVVRGASGAPGKASGPARIVHTNLDLKNVREGDVVVAHMTRQDFVPYLRKAAALVTNEGGVACHAAIIARELKVPCVVGARNATAVFKDGDEIEVDADMGTVRKS